MTHYPITRRRLVAGLAATTGLAIAGCGQARDPDTRTANASASTAKPVSAASAMTVYRDPTCGCCEAWAGIARNAGYQVQVIDRPDMPAIKQQYGVPDDLLSCHTTIIGGYAVEGHVPIEHVQRLLKEKPAGIRGIGVAGMPLGSPGMEVPDGTRQQFQVMAFDAGGRVSVFRG